MAEEAAVVDIISPDDMTPAETAAFMDKGTIPTRKPEPATGDDEPTSDEPDSVTDDEPESGAAPDAADKNTQDKGTQKPWKETRDGRRITRLSEENRKLQERLSALESGKTPQAQTQDKPDGKPAERKPAPKLKDFEKWEDYEDARDKHDAEQRKMDLAEAIASERETASKGDREAKAKEASEKATNAYVKRCSDFRKTLKEDNFVEQFEEVVAMVADYPHLSEAIRDSEVGPQLTAYFAQNPDEFDKIAARGVTGSLTALGKLEVSAKFSTPAQRKITAVKGGTMDVGGKGGSSDLMAEINEALEAGDDAKADRLMAKMEAQEEKLARRR